MKVVWPKTPLAANTVVGGRTRGQRCVELQHAVIEGIGNIYIAVRVHSDPAAAGDKTRTAHRVLAVGALKPWLQAIAVKLRPGRTRSPAVVIARQNRTFRASPPPLASGSRYTTTRLLTVSATKRSPVVGLTLSPSGEHRLRVAGGVVSMVETVAKRGGEVGFRSIELAEYQVRRQLVLTRSRRRAGVTEVLRKRRRERCIQGREYFRSLRCRGRRWSQPRRPSESTDWSRLRS